MACHGKAGKGGVRNPNYHKNTIPALNTLAEKMFLYEPEDAEAIVSALERDNDLLAKGPQSRIRRYAAIQTQFRAVRKVIAAGNAAGKKDPAGPQPFNMPAWDKSISAREITAVTAHIIRLFDYDVKGTSAESLYTAARRKAKGL